MKLSKLKDEKLPNNIKNRQEFLLKHNNNILGYVSFFFKSNEMIIDNLSVKNQKKNYEESIITNLIQLCIKKNIENITIINNIPALLKLKLNKSSISVSRIKIPKEKQKDIKYALEEAEAKETLSKALEELPLK